ncbi:MAG: flagellar hook-associated protein FlgL [Gallionella sp.]
MRISSNTIFNNAVANMDQQQVLINQTQQQISSGQRMQTAADDPTGGARALIVTQTDAMNTQYMANGNAAQGTLSLASATLQSVTGLIQAIQSEVIQAGNGAYSNADRSSMATQMSSQLQELVGLANSTDSSGNYLFSGFQTNTQPFANTPAGIGYFGDSGQRNVQVSATQQIAANDNGANVFMNIKNGNGTFATQAGTNSLTPGPNLGSGIISIGSIANPPPTLPLDNYSLSFTVTPGVAGAPDVTTYDVTDTTTGTAVSTGNPYVSGQNINFAGVQFNIQGAPANGDTFTVTPSSNVSIFQTISDLITTLNTPVSNSTTGGVSTTTSLTNSLSYGLNNLGNALNNILTTQSSLGSRQNVITSLQSTGSNLGLQYQQTLSQLQGVDMAQAISNLTQQQTNLQAAEKSFAATATLSLFSYLR